MAEFTTLEHHDGIAVLQMHRPKVNALSAAFMDEMTEQLEAAQRDGAIGFVWTAQGKTFSAGLDLVELQSADREAIVEVLGALYRLARALFTFPRPVVAAMNGHAIAGGAYLALACDRRLMIQGESRFGLTESAIGLSIPAHGVPMVDYALSREVSEEMLYGAATYTPDRARELGAIDLVVKPDTLLDAALEDIRSRTPSLTAYADIKRRLRAPALERMDAARAKDEEWVDLWFSEDARRRVADLVSRLGR